MIAGLLDHIWQSSLFAGAVAVLVLFFRRNHASLRFWLWFAASLKFLVPFAGLAALGHYLARQFPAPLPPSLLAIQPAAEKLSAPVRTLAASHAHSVEAASGISLAPLLAGLWLTGVAAILGLHLLRMVRLRRLADAARDLPVAAPVRIKASPSLMEPGLVGIFRPVVMLPDGLMNFLSAPERESILAHELTHLRRRDNVTAAIHMAVEALFWFYPPVWLIGSRLIAERERACDESVVASGHDPEVYAGGILKVCKFCIQSPLACAAGVSGADLGNRMRQIMSDEVLLGLTPAKRSLLAAAAALALTLPVMVGFAGTPLMVQMKRQVIAVQARAQQVVTQMAQQIVAAPAPQRLPRLKVQVALPQPSVLQAAPEPQQRDITPPAEPVPAPIVQEPSAMAPPVKEAAPQEATAAATDADAITCREPQPIPGSRLLGPQVCRTNQQWADLRARHQDIGPDGRSVVSVDAAGRVCNDMRTLDWATSNSGKLPAKFCF